MYVCVLFMEIGGIFGVMLRCFIFGKLGGIFGRIFWLLIGGFCIFWVREVIVCIELGDRGFSWGGGSFCMWGGIGNFWVGNLGMRMCGDIILCLFIFEKGIFWVILGEWWGSMLNGVCT